MNLEIITPEKKLFEGTVKLVQVPGTDGSFEMLENHAPIISTLNAGKVRIIDENDKENLFDVDKGVIELKNNKIILLTEKVFE